MVRKSTRGVNARGLEALAVFRATTMQFFVKIVVYGIMASVKTCPPMILKSRDNWRTIICALLARTLEVVLTTTKPFCVLQFWAKCDAWKWSKIGDRTSAKYARSSSQNRWVTLWKQYRGYRREWYTRESWWVIIEFYIFLTSHSISAREA